MPKKKHRVTKAKRIILKKNHFLEVYQEMRQIAPLVLEILKKKPKARDYDKVLHLLVWKAQGMKEAYSHKKFKYGYIMGKYAHPETIGRTRRKIQENKAFKHLRGTMYKQRQLAQNKLEKKIKNQLSFW